MANPAKINVTEFKRGAFQSNTAHFQRIDTNGTVPLDCNLNTDGLSILLSNESPTLACKATILAGTDRGAVTAKDIEVTVPKKGANSIQIISFLDATDHAFSDKTFRLRFEGIGGVPVLYVAATRWLR